MRLITEIIVAAVLASAFCSCSTTTTVVGCSSALCPGSNYYVVRFSVGDCGTTEMTAVFEDRLVETLPGSLSFPDASKKIQGILGESRSVKVTSVSSASCEGEVYNLLRVMGSPCFREGDRKVMVVPLIVSGGSK